MKNKSLRRLRCMRLLQSLPARCCAEALRSEHPQIIACALSIAPASKSGKILSKFTERLRNDVALRMCSIGEVSESWLLAMDRGLSQSLLAEKNRKASRFGGLPHAAGALRRIGEPLRKNALDGISEYDPELYYLLLHHIDKKQPQAKPKKGKQP